MESVQAQIAKLREEMRAEQLQILKVAAERRKRARPGEAQKIILWETNSLRHAETKYMAKIDRLMKEAIGEMAPRRPEKAAKTGFSDKRPSQKVKRTSE
ncbi:MAG: hypothetical protein QXD77_03065 [Candidatus Aenigmatarchaeota archaeon]